MPERASAACCLPCLLLSPAARVREVVPVPASSGIFITGPTPLILLVRLEQPQDAQGNQTDEAK